MTYLSITIAFLFGFIQFEISLLTCERKALFYITVRMLVNRMFSCRPEKYSLALFSLTFWTSRYKRAVISRTPQHKCVNIGIIIYFSISSLNLFVIHLLLPMALPALMSFIAYNLAYSNNNNLFPRNGQYIFLSVIFSFELRPSTWLYEQLLLKTLLTKL